VIHRRRTIDLFAVQQQTASNHVQIQNLARRALDAQLDPRKPDRIAARQCPLCFYIREWFCGQGFTDWICSHCGKEDTWADTCTPYLCNDCADKLDLCIMCVADRNLSQRRKLQKK
jgi:hypothetical protein